MKDGRITIKQVGKASDGNPLWTYDAHGIGGGSYKKYPDASTHEELYNFLDDRGWYLENVNYHEVKIYPIGKEPIDKEPVEIEESARKPYRSVFTGN
jgi:hypothetical protein